MIPGAKDMGMHIQAYLYDGYWEDIGTVEAFYEANLALTDEPVPKFRHAPQHLGGLLLAQFCLTFVAAILSSSLTSHFKILLADSNTVCVRCHVDHESPRSRQLPATP